jgi:hypothetical protein
MRLAQSTELALCTCQTWNASLSLNVEMKRVDCISCVMYTSYSERECNDNGI